MEKQNIEKAEKAINRARGHILIEHPFYSTRAMQLELIPAKQYKNNTIETAGTNGKVIVYNPDYINTLNHEQIIFLLAHEYWHVNLLHHVRRSNRDLKDWNRAGDYTINDILLNDSVGQWIDGLLFREDLKGNATEKNYSILNQEKRDQEKDPGQDETASDQDETGPEKQIINNPAGGVFDLEPDDLEPGQTFEDETENIKTDLMNDISFSEKAGHGLSEYTRELLSDRIFSLKVNWKQILQAWLQENLKSGFSYIKPSYRSNNGFILPGLYSEDLGKVIIALDVSGSITGRENALETFQNELNELRIAYQFDTTLIYFHSHIVKIDEYQKHETITIKIPSTGGTNIEPVFNWISDNNLNNQISGLIVFTDLEIFDYPEQDPIYPVLWVQYGNDKNWLPEFGRITECND